MLKSVLANYAQRPGLRNPRVLRGLMKALMRCIGRWLVVAAFAGMGHASATTPQVGMSGWHKARQPQRVDSCPQCRAGPLAPAFETNPTGDDDPPEHVAPGSSMWRKDEPRDALLQALSNVIRPNIALRIRYCRWLN
jgi:hypothetical protein